MHRILAVQKTYNNGLELMIYVYEKWQLLLLLILFFFQMFSLKQYVKHMNEEVKNIEKGD